MGSKISRNLVMSNLTTSVIALILVTKMAWGITPTYPPTSTCKPLQPPIPSFMQCGYKHLWENNQMAITYDRLIMDHTSGVHLGSFDVDEGIFTAGTPGVYSVDFSSSVTYNTLNDYIEVYLLLNGVVVPESRFWSRNGDVKGWFPHEGSCKMKLELKEGDTLQLFGDYPLHILNRFVFCVSAFE